MSPCVSRGFLCTGRQSAVSSIESHDFAYFCCDSEGGGGEEEEEEEGAEAPVSLRDRRKFYKRSRNNQPLLGDVRGETPASTVAQGLLEPPLLPVCRRESFRILDNEMLIRNFLPRLQV